MEFDNIPDNVKQSYQQAKLPIQKQPKQQQPSGKLPVDLNAINYLIYYGKSLTWTMAVQFILRSPLKLFGWLVNKRYIQIRQFLIAFFGPRVDQAELKERFDICAECPVLVTKGKHLYCGVCSCPKWFLSRLAKKLRYKKYYCPLQKHSGEYPYSHSFIYGVKKQGCKSCRNKSK